MTMNSIKNTCYFINKLQFKVTLFVNEYKLYKKNKNLIFM